jgi:hypothetical protein
VSGNRSEEEKIVVRRRKVSGNPSTLPVIGLCRPLKLGRATEQVHLDYDSLIL